ncbi:MAG: hypothetical protein O2780_21630 [Proteobacteria bacterium]|jgi:hypothetical protein|nr:hypothetical protein [Pseudomonadota bacterium]MDA1298886.1 hypothetical protein [Pseudomonadota bacterium]
MDLPPINRVSEFSDLGLEHRFRAENIDRARRVNYLTAFPILAACILFMANDIQQGGVSWTIIAARILLAMIVIASVFVTRTRTHWQEVHNITYLMTVLVMLTVAWIDYRRPPDFLTHLGVDIIVIMGAYASLPTVRSSMILTTLFTLYLVGLHILVKQPTFQLDNYTVPASLLLANVFGLSMALLYQRVQRQFFAQLLEAKSISEELILARTEVQSLSALIPMCSGCNKIRVEDGQWTHLETYMQAISGSQVSHGICPDCERRLYGDLGTDH